MNRILLVGLTCLLLAGLASCSGDDLTVSSGGYLNVYLTDAPIDLDNITAVNVEVAAMTVFPACDGPDDECEKIVLDLVPAAGNDPVVVNLLDYRDGAVLLMASEEVPEGMYEKIRLEIADASLLRDDDQDPDTPESMEPIFVPSRKVDVVVPFAVTAGDGAEIILDFDAALSVHLHETGNHRYILRPVINGSRR